jgi:spastin
MSDSSLFQQHYTKSTEQIQRGLSYDEQGNKQMALKHYTAALHAINSCLNTSVHHQRNDLVWVEKIRKNREMITPRITELQRVINQQVASPPIQDVHLHGTSSSSQAQNSFFSGLWNWLGGTDTDDGLSQQQQQQPIQQQNRTTSNVTQQHQPIQQQQQQMYASNSRLNQLHTPLHRSSNQAISSNHQDLNRRQPQARSVNHNQQNTMPHTTQKQQQQQQQQQKPQNHTPRSNPASSSSTTTPPRRQLPVDKIPELKNVDKKLLDHILNEIVQNDQAVKWEDIAGLKDAKQILHETIVLPSLRPDIFQGLRAAPKGVLLFGVPGNGKTLLAKAVSSQCKATFFSISASTLVSKWHGEGEKLVKALFAAANYLAPSVIFIDEIDSILTSRSTNEHEASRRMKTEFLVQLDGVTANLNPNNRVLVMGATNLPQELDEAILRRFTKRIFIPLPDREARAGLIKNALGSQRTKLSQYDLDRIAAMTEGYSGSDLRALCQEASMVAIREMDSNQLLVVDANKVRPLNVKDFELSLKRVRPSISNESIQELLKWNKKYGTVTI